MRREPAFLQAALCDKEAACSKRNALGAAKAGNLAGGQISQRFIDARLRFNRISPDNHVTCVNFARLEENRPDEDFSPGRRCGLRQGALVERRQCRFSQGDEAGQSGASHLRLRWGVFRADMRRMLAFSEKLERAKRFELSTPTLARKP
ncbi:hypothetical protein [Parasphingorhabdus sp.]|uniref:hypothetical protein n=1 Tax=Parasphingorhabdus sp. TaxID=2709688 RepID=UPI003001DD12